MFVTSTYKMQKILQLKEIYSLEVTKFMHKNNKSQLPTAFNSYFKRSTDAHPLGFSLRHVGQNFR